MSGILFTIRSLPCLLMLSPLGLWQMQLKVVKEVSSVIHLDTMEAGPDYCVKAQTYVEAINRSSSFSQTQCVRVQGNSHPSFLFPWFSHAQGHPSSSSFPFHPIPPVLFANVLPICSLGKEKRKTQEGRPCTGTGILPWSVPTKDLTMVDGKISHRGCRLTALSGLSSQGLPLRSFAASVISRWHIHVAGHCLPHLCWLCRGCFDPALRYLENKQNPSVFLLPCCSPARHTGNFFYCVLVVFRVFDIHRSMRQAEKADSCTGSLAHSSMIS